jgi:hypothetical protein
MFPSELLTSDFFLSYAHSRLEKCLQVAKLLYDKLTFVEISSYTTFLQWEAENTEMTFSEYKQNIESINDALRSIQCCMPPLYKLPHVAAQTDLSVTLRSHCQSVRDFIPMLLRLDIPEITAFLSATYEKLERQLEHIMALQHRVLIIIPILRKQFLSSPEYIEDTNRSVETCTLYEVMYIVSAFENRLLRFHVNNYVVHHDPDDVDEVSAT